MKKITLVLGLMINTACEPIKPPAEGSANQRPQSIRPQGAAPEAGKAMFEDLVSLIRSNKSPRCLNCHNTPDNLAPPGIQGPQEIFDYQHMLGRLKEGNFSNDNYLINKFLGKTPHTGNIVCRAEADPICMKVKEWWLQELGDGVGDKSVGRIYQVSVRGLISGIAKDDDQPDKTFTVRIYRQDANETPVLVGEGLANNQKLLGGDFSDRVFEIQIPLTMVDNQKHSLKAFVLEESEEVPLGSKFEYTAYQPRGENPEFSQIGIVRGAGCQGCHGANAFSYQNLWDSLAFPAPHAGGAGRKNHLYLYSIPNSTNTLGHQVVGTSDRITAWWCVEFDPQKTTADCQ